MRFGLRPQWLLASAGLCLLAFAPLFFAVASLTRATFRFQRDADTYAVGHGLAQRFVTAQSIHTEEELTRLVDEELAATPLLWGVAMENADGRVWLQRGVTIPLGPLGQVARDRNAMPLLTARGHGLAVTAERQGSSVVVVVAAGERNGPDEATLVSLVGLYTAAIAGCLVLFLYIALTRLVVRPLEELTQAAQQVARGARQFSVPRRGGAELLDLGASVAIMTAQLRQEEDALRVKVTALEETTQRLAEAQAHVVRSAQLASVGRLAAGLAHEVGNPLAALLGLLDLLLETELSPAERQDFLRRMRDETQRIHHIVRGLLDFARPVTVTASSRSSRSSLSSLTPSGHLDVAIRDVLDLLRAQRDAREVSIELDLALNLPAVPLRTSELVQVVLNLMLNAVDAAGAGGHVILRTRAEPGEVQLEVEDNGPGVDPAVRDVLFEPFVTTKAVGQGTGLGLGVCRGLVEGAGGTITSEARSQGHRGALFRVRIPLIPLYPLLITFIDLWHVRYCGHFCHGYE